MHIQSFQTSPLEAQASLIVLGVFANAFDETLGFTHINEALQGALTEAMQEQDFTGKPKQQCIVFNTSPNIKAKRIAVVGLGSKNTVNQYSWVQLGGIATRIGNSVNATHVALALPNEPHICNNVARGAVLGSYQYDTFKTEKSRTKSVQHVHLHYAGEAPAQLSERANILASAIALARHLVNEPPSHLYPETFAQQAQKVAAASGLTCTIYNEQELANMNMHMMLAVGQGSIRPPRMVHLVYTPERVTPDTPCIGLVGKGITFDSGGLCLKDPANMLDMKVDMSGAATVLATMQAVAALKPNSIVHGFLALAENMPSGTAYRLGDVLTSAAGKTVEINNTDAEGRLVLGDTLHFAKQQGVHKIIDLATLTGACMIALGPNTTGVFSNNDAWCNDILQASQRAGEDMWRMPLTPSLREQLKSDIADMRNTGERYGGAITAALFLKEFVGDLPWAHLDIAGPATTKEDSGAYTKGATGVAVATLIELLCR